MADILDHALTDVASVKESLGIASGDTSKDNLITRKINQATLIIEGFCGLANGYHFKQATYTDDLYDATDSDTIVLRMRPVTTFTSLARRNGSESNSSFDTVDTDFYFVDLASGVIELLFAATGRWNTYKATYVAGYQTIPADLAEACVTMSCFFVENSASGTAVKKKQEGSRSIEYFQASSGTNESVITQLGLDDTLSRYKRYTLADTL